MILVGLVVFLAVFTQSLSGFGVALVAMALLPALIGIQVATPLVALIALVLEAVLVFRYRQSIGISRRLEYRLGCCGWNPLGVFS